MKHKNVEVGQRVLVKRSTSVTCAIDADDIGKEFTVISMEPLSYSGEGTVFVQSVDNDGVQFWCNHRDLSKVKEASEPAAPAPAQPQEEVAPCSSKVGDKFRVVSKAGKFHSYEIGDIVTLVALCDGGRGHQYGRATDGKTQWLLDSEVERVQEPKASPAAETPKVGDLFRVAASDFHGFEGGAIIQLRVLAADGVHGFEDLSGFQQFVEPQYITPLSKDDIWEILKSRPTHKEQPKPEWPYPEGTQVTLTEEGQGKAHHFGYDPGAVYTLGSDGTTVPPLLDSTGKHVFYVISGQVKPV